MQELEALPHRPELRYTPTEKRILAILSDGESHLAKDMLECLDGEFSEKATLSAHVVNIRNKLPADQWIVCEVKGRKTYYRHVIKYNAKANGSH